MLTFNSTTWARVQFRGNPHTIYVGRNVTAIGFSPSISLFPIPVIIPTINSQYFFISREGNGTIELSSPRRNSLNLIVHLQNQRSQWVLGSKQPTVQREPQFLPEVKWSGWDVEHLLPPSAQFKHEQSYSYASLCVFMSRTVTTLLYLTSFLQTSKFGPADSAKFVTMTTNELQKDCKQRVKFPVDQFSSHRNVRWSEGNAPVIIDVYSITLFQGWNKHTHEHTHTHTHSMSVFVFIFMLINVHNWRSQGTWACQILS
jgi:hypothetical protein